MNIKEQERNAELFEINTHMRFVVEERERLRNVVGSPSWAVSKMQRYDRLADFLAKQYRMLLMTGFDGKRIE